MGCWGWVQPSIAKTTKIKVHMRHLASHHTFHNLSNYHPPNRLIYRSHLTNHTIHQCLIDAPPLITITPSLYPSLIHPINPAMLLSTHMWKVQVAAAQAAAAAGLHFCRYKKTRKIGSRYGSPICIRQRRSVQSIFLCLGDVYFRCAYRMSYESFCRLSDSWKVGSKRRMNSQ